MTEPVSPTSYAALLEYVCANVDPSILTSDKTKQDFLAYLHNLTVKACRERFYVFVKKMMPSIIPEDFRDGVHIKIMCDNLQSVFEAITSGSRDGRKLRTSISPGSSKTLICSILFPAWCLGQNPAWRIIAVAHGKSHAETHLGGPTKQLVMSSEYQEIFPRTLIKKDSHAKGHWSTTKGGYYSSNGVGGAIAGKRANIAICDDIVSEQTAESRLEREKINQWYIPGLRTRLLPEAGEINTLTRWALNDVAGYIEETDAESRPWKTIEIPAVLDQKTLDLYKEYQPDLDPEQFFVGGSYWPQYKPLSDILDMKATMQPRKYAAMYTQHPIPLEGSIFKERQFKRWTVDSEVPVTHTIVSLDTAFTEEERKDAARSAFSVWGIFPRKEIDGRGRESLVGNMILLGAEAGYWSWPELTDKCEWLKDAVNPDVFIIEKRASGISLIQDLRARGFTIGEYMPDKSKEARAWAAASQVDAGRIWVNPNKQFTKEFLAEVLAFPNADLKDYVDTFSNAVLWCRDNLDIVPEKYIMYDDLHDEKPRQKRHTYWTQSTH